MYMIKLPLIARLNLILTWPEFISFFNSFSILVFSSSFISSRTRHIDITINIRDTTLDMDWSDVSINNFSWSVFKYYNETMSSWTLMWFESMVCCVLFFLLVFFFSFFLCVFLFLIFWVCLVYAGVQHILCCDFVLFVFVLYFVLPKVASFSGLSIFDQHFYLSNVYLGYQTQINMVIYKFSFSCLWVTIFLHSRELNEWLHFLI